MDWTSIVVAVIAFIGTFGGSLAGIKASNKLMEYRIDKLEAKVDKHNNLIDRTYKLEERSCLIEQKLDELI